MLRMLSDEDLNGRIVRAMRRMEPNLDLVRVQEVGLMGEPDEIILEWAAKEDRILLTQDATTMPPGARDRVNQGLAVPGIIIVPRTMPIGQAVDELLLIARFTDAQEWKDKGITYLPVP